MIQLQQASDVADWQIASTILMDCLPATFENGKTLWLSHKLTAEYLSQHNPLSSLHFIFNGGERVGLVFIQQQDTLYWPELKQDDSIFIHKLTLMPKAKKQGMGYQVLEQVAQLGRHLGKQWFRLDCQSDRPKLVEYYAQFGFSPVDEVYANEVYVVRFELLL